MLGRWGSEQATTVVGGRGGVEMFVSLGLISTELVPPANMKLASAFLNSS